MTRSEVPVFDMDGTLFEGAVAGDAWMDGAALQEHTKPRWDICHAVMAKVSDLVVVTGRTHFVFGSTQQQLLDVFGSVELHTRPLSVSFSELANWKARTLRMLGCTLYVGDSAADQAAAEQAGARWLSPEAFRDLVMLEVTACARSPLPRSNA